MNKGSSGAALHGDVASKDVVSGTQGANASRMAPANSDEVARRAPLFEFEMSLGSVQRTLV